MYRVIIALFIAVLFVTAVWVYKNPHTSKHYYTKISEYFTATDHSTNTKPRVSTSPQKRILSQEELQFFNSLKNISPDKLVELATEENLQKRDEHGNTLLHHMVTRRHTAHTYKTISLILELPNFDINSTNIYGHTALHSAAINNSSKFIPLLLQYGIDHKLPDKKGMLAVHHAKKFKKVRSLNILSALD